MPEEISDPAVCSDESTIRSCRYAPAICSPRVPTDLYNTVAQRLAPAAEIIYIVAYEQYRMSLGRVAARGSNHFGHVFANRVAS